LGAALEGFGAGFADIGLLAAVSGFAASAKFCPFIEPSLGNSATNFS
jgi:hypothetical protein